MPPKKIKKVDGIGHKSMSSAIEEFMKHCRRKNLAKATMEYYEEDLTYFQRVMQVQTTGEICKELLENFVDHEMNKGNKITAINSRIRGLRVFFKFCADLGYCKPFKFPLIKPLNRRRRFCPVC